VLDIRRKKCLVAKLHNIVLVICGSPQRRERFVHIQGKDLSSNDKSNIDHLNLLLDNTTRWNSLCLMIDPTLKLKDWSESFCVDNGDELPGAPKSIPQADRQPLSSSLSL
jgi:hypothetical protein